MKWWEVVVMLIALGVIIACALVLSGCPHPTPTPKPIDLSGVQTCPSGFALPTTDDVCEGMFTTEGFACVNCSGASGCLDAMDSVYCVLGSCTTDPLCHYTNGVAARRRK